MLQCNPIWFELKILYPNREVFKMKEISLLRKDFAERRYNVQIRTFKRPESYHLTSQSSKLKSLFQKMLKKTSHSFHSKSRIKIPALAQFAYHPFIFFSQNTENLIPFTHIKIFGFKIILFTNLLSFFNVLSLFRSSVTPRVAKKLQKYLNKNSVNMIPRASFSFRD